MTDFFTSDHHFGHQAIIERCNRPYSSVEEMDEDMIARWNAVVRPRDNVWYLGDLTMDNGGKRGRVFDEKRLRSIFHRLNGNKRLIIGNHDGRHVLALPWSEPPEMLRSIKINRQRYVLCHYGLRVWEGIHKGAIHLYGHSHGRLPGVGRALDVGVDSWNYTPASVEDIQARITMQADPDYDPEVHEQPGMAP